MPDVLSAFQALNVATTTNYGRWINDATAATWPVQYYTTAYTSASSTAITVTGGGGYTAGGYYTYEAEQYRWEHNYQQQLAELDRQMRLQGPWLEETPAPMPTPPRVTDVHERTAPEQVARALLLSVLTPEQQASYARDNWIELVGPSGRRYRVYVTAGRHGNIYEVDASGRRTQALCCAPRNPASGYLPDSDCFLTQVLALQHDEDRFRSAANISRLVA